MRASARGGEKGKEMKVTATEGERRRQDGGGRGAQSQRDAAAGMLRE